VKTVSSTDQIATAEARRRKLIRIATAYALVSWVLLQLGEIVFDPLQLPPWSLTALILFLVLAFPPVIILAWSFEGSRKGLKRLRNEQGAPVVSTFMILLVLALDSVAGVFLFRVYGPEKTPTEASGALQAMSEAPVPAPHSAPANTIAVLPFVDLSPDRDQGYFSDGISEEILNVLARINGLQVAARTSSFAFKGQDRDIREIGGLLNVATVLEGSIRKQGDSVRVTAQLIDTSNGFHLWSNNYDRSLEDIFAIQDEIASEIVNELLGSYEGFARAETAAPAIASFEAYDLYLQGRALWRQRTPESLAEAIVIFERTIELDASYAAAYSGLADTYLLLTNYGNMAVATAVEKASPLIQTALQLDGQMSEGFASLGLMYWILGRNSAGEAHLRRAVKLDPENTTAMNWLGGLIGSEGRLGEQMVIMRSALEKDPVNELLNINVADIHLQRGEIDAGLERLQRMLEVYPTSTQVLRALAAWHSTLGRFSEAYNFASRALEIAPDEPTGQATMTHLLLTMGALEPASRILQTAMENGEDNIFVAPSYMRYLLMSDRLDQLRAFANAQLESAASANVASTQALFPSLWLGIADLIEGEHEQALARFDQVVEEEDSLPPMFAANALTWSAAAHLIEQHPDLARDRLDRAQRITGELRLQGITHSGIHYLEACIAALGGDVDSAVTALTHATDQGWLDVWQAEHDTRLANLRSDQRFEQWLEQMRTRNAEALMSIDLEQLAGL
jgi:TolB-like protein/Tfp pilus assembly protein PilF